ncbi:MAG: XrtA system polysaccharide deacetylase [Planctomycetota bacterium]
MLPDGPEHAGEPPGTGPLPHLLSFDVEEYFQVEAARHCVSRDEWLHRPRRLAGPVERILELLYRHRTRATFFVLGWVARHEPEIVRRIADAGHEIASHGMSHQMLTRLTREELGCELSDSRKLLEDLAGRPVQGFRAPTFSILHGNAGALDALAEAGYAYDSSIFPVRHDRYGVPDAPCRPHWAVGPGGGTLLELPLLTLRALGQNWPAAGGGYLRLLPVRVLARALQQNEARGLGGMMYLHPWEFDPHQPVLAMGRAGRWRHRVGLARTHKKLDWLLGRHRFADVRSSLDRLGKVAEGHSYVYGGGRGAVEASTARPAES